MSLPKHPLRVLLCVVWTLVSGSGSLWAAPVLQAAADGTVVVSGSGGGFPVPDRLGGEVPYAVVPLEDGLVAGATGSGDADAGLEIALVVQQDGQARRLALPTRERALRLAPVPLVSGGDLAGLAWLEGDGPRGLAVRWAGRDGEGWLPPRTLAAPGPGTQIALDGCVLADGRHLLAWAAFDGRDDEILWTVGDSDGFSTPRRLHAANEIPDVTPRLLCSADGNHPALVVWSAYEDGHYRLRVGRFDGAGWRPVSRLPGLGAVEPSIHRFDGRPLVLYRTAEAQAWRVAELTPDGAPRRLAAAAGSDRERPLLSVTARGPVLSWGAGLPAIHRSELGPPADLVWRPAEESMP